MDKTYDLTYISYGAGVQSTALLVCSALGLYNVPKADIAIFADTGDEPQYVYEYLAMMQEWIKPYNIPILIAKKGITLSESFIDNQNNGSRFVSVPLFVNKVTGTSSSEAVLRRQCTSEFKLRPIVKTVREYLGIKYKTKSKKTALALIGISTDEAIRMKDSKIPWITNSYPLIDANLDRTKCKNIVVQQGLPEPKKSACVFCPYRSKEGWIQLKTQFPKDFEKAVEFDRKIRNMETRGRKFEAFVHRQRIPLDQVDFDSDKDQIDMFGNECEGMCGV